MLLHCHVTKLELEAVDRQRQAAASQLGKAKRSLQEICMAETKTHAETAFDGPHRARQACLMQWFAARRHEPCGGDGRVDRAQSAAEPCGDRSQD